MAYYNSSIDNYDYVQYSNIERFNITGTIANDYIQTGDGNDTTGFDGNDSLIGGARDDRMLGGKGDDTYYLDNTGDRAIKKADEGIDTVISTITYTLLPNVENLILEGTANINATGNILNNIITGNSGNNRINGRAGADTMAGRFGDDTYFVDNTGDVIIENADEEIDTVHSTVTYTLADNVEYLLFTRKSVYSRFIGKYRRSSFHLQFEKWCIILRCGW